MAGRELGRGGIEGGKGTASGKHAPAAWLIKICGKRGTKHCAYSKYSQHKSPETNNTISNVLYSSKKRHTLTSDLPGVSVSFPDVWKGRKCEQSMD